MVQVPQVEGPLAAPTPFTRVTDDLWRSARPAGEAAFAAIRAQFRSVISLEGLAEDEREAVELEPTGVISRPISAWQIYAIGITQGALEVILETIAQAPKPALVHCQHGQDRTGLVVAAYRVVSCDWSKEAAMDEALRFGYRDWLNFGLNRTWTGFASEESK